MPDDKAKQVKPDNKRLKFHHLRHPFMVPVVTFLVLFFLSMVLFINQNGQTVGASDSRVVELSMNGKLQTIPTTAPTVGILLSRLHITLNPGDVVEPSPNTPILDNGFQLNIYRVHPVTVVESGKKTVVLTANNNPKAIAEQAGYTVYPEDIVNQTTNPDILDQSVLGQEVTIQPSTPVSLDLYGQQVNLRTQAKTVQQLLEQKDIKTSAGNNVIPSLATAITPGMQILVVPVGQKLASTQQSIPFTTQNVADSSIPFGATTVEQAGVNGLSLVVEDTTTTNGVTTTTPLQTVVINQPISEIVGHGTGIAPTPGGDNISWLKSSDISPGDYGYADYIISHESHWNPAAVNSNDCIGLGQSCNRSLAVTCPDWQIDAVCQLDFFNSYVEGHGYGSWAGAAAFWASHGYW